MLALLYAFFPILILPAINFAYESEPAASPQLDFARFSPQSSTSK